MLDETYKDVQRLSLKQVELLKQALRCVENELYRAAHILSWIALMDLIENILSSDGFKGLKSVRPKWSTQSLDDLREGVAEFQIIEACKDLKLLQKSEMRVLHGLLGKRNLCAHPGDYFPDYNQTLGYIADILNVIKIIQKKHYKRHVNKGEKQS